MILDLVISNTLYSASKKKKEGWSFFFEFLQITLLEPLIMGFTQGHKIPYS